MANKELRSITFEGLDNTYTLLTEEEVNTKLSEYAKTSEITQIDIQTVNALPEVGVKGVIYLVPSTLRMTPLLSNRLATVQANTNNSATFSVDKTTNIKAGMTLKLVNNGTMGDVVVKSIDAKTKTITLTKPATLAKGTLIFDGSKYGKDTHEEYIWNPSTNKFERLGIVDVNAVSTATPQSVVARDWNGRAQIENPYVAKDIANKDYVDNAVSDKITMGDLMGAISDKLDSTALGNFTFDTDTLKNTNSGAKITLGSDGSQYIPDDLEITKNGISRKNLDDGVGVNNWSITGGGSVSPRMEVGSKSETLENIVNAPSKIASKQDTLVSGTNIKTINGESVLGEGNITVTPTVDDTLSDTSTDAVQNKVVKAAIDGKLSRTTDKQKVYATNSAGVDTTLPYEYKANTGTVAVRGDKGVLQVGTPTDDSDATTKKYVDNASNGKLDKVSSLTYEAYVHIGNIQSTMPFTASMDNSAGGDCAVLLGRDSNGRAQVNEPVEDKDIANKKYVDDAITATDISEIAKDYTVLNSKNWSTTYANTGDIGEFGVPDYTSSKYPIIYNQPVNEEVIELAEIRNTDTNTTIATFTSKEELGTSKAATAYHFGNNYTLLVIHPQDGDYKTMMDGAIPYSSWTYNYCIGVYLTGAITNTSGELWVANNIPTTANLTISFPTPLVAPKGYKTLLDSSYFTRYKYTIYDDGRKECEILACAENVTINSTWGSLYEGTLGSYSFKSGFFTFEPEIHLEMLNTVTGDGSGGVACFIETGLKPTTTSTGTLYAVRPNSSATAKKIYFKIHAKQV